MRSLRGVCCPPRCAPPRAADVQRLERSDIWAASRLLLKAFEPPGGLNPVQRVLVFGEHALGLRERFVDNVMLKAVDGRSLVGFIEIYTPEYLASQAGTAYPERVRGLLKPYVASLAVSETVRRQGVGDALVLAAEERVQGMNRTAIALEVEESNAAAMALYTARGYRAMRRDEKGRKLVGDVFFGRSERVTKLWLEKDLTVGY